jgi:hypothetical protein
MVLSRRVLSFLFLLTLFSPVSLRAADPTSVPNEVNSVIDHYFDVFHSDFWKGEGRDPGTEELRQLTEDLTLIETLLREYSMKELREDADEKIEASMIGNLFGAEAQTKPPLADPNREQAFDVFRQQFSAGQVLAILKLIQDRLEGEVTSDNFFQSVKQGFIDFANEVRSALVEIASDEQLSQVKHSDTLGRFQRFGRFIARSPRGPATRLFLVNSGIAIGVGMIPVAFRADAKLPIYLGLTTFAVTGALMGGRYWEACAEGIARRKERRRG